MTVYSDEVNIYNPSAIGTAITNAENAYKVVITEVDQNGVKVHPSSQDGSQSHPIVDYTLMDTEGTHIYESGTEVASFGQTARIGASSSGHTVVDSTGMEVFSDSTTSMAKFSSSGARIGAENGARVSIGSDSMTVTNDDGNPWFNIDMDAGTLSTQTSINGEIGGVDVGLTTTGKTVTGDPGKIDVSAIPSGTSFTVCHPPASYTSGNFLVLITAPGTWSTSSATVSSNAYCATSSKRLMMYAKSTSTVLTLTKGTALSTPRTYSATNLKNSSSNITVGITITVSYDGGNEVLFTPTVTASTTSSSYVGQSVNVSVYPRTALYTAVSNGAAFTFGTRKSGEDSGVLSTTLGEGLEASSKDQVAVGMYNACDSNYAFMVGNGTASQASNAMSVEWNGTVNLASPLPIASGGTGQTAVTTKSLGSSTTPTYTEIFSPASGITNVSVNYAQFGKLAMLEIYFKHTSAWAWYTNSTTSNQYNIGTLTTNYRPKINSAGTGNTSMVAAVLTTGAVYLRPVYNWATDLAANGAVYARFTYILA